MEQITQTCFVHERLLTNQLSEESISESLIKTQKVSLTPTGIKR